MIGRTIHQVWVGPADPPLKWMATWREMNPDWEYRLWGNAEVLGSRRWRNQRMIDHYVAKAGEVAVTGEFRSAQGAVFRGST